MSQGDSIDFNTFRKAPTVECLLRLPGVKQADISPVCCTEDNKVMIFLGVSDLLKKPTDDSRYKADLELPAEIVAANNSLENGQIEAITSGQATEDDSEGHALFHFPGAERQQKKFIAYANEHLPELRKVLKSAKDPKQRNVASWVIAYHDDKPAVVPDLVAAVNDPDPGVRNNVTRALGIMMAYFERKNITVGIDPAPFVELVKSIDWTDRNKGVYLLVVLTNKHNPALLARLRKEAVLPLADMAVWQSQGHAYPAFSLLGRVAGWDEKTIYERGHEDRVKWVDQLLATLQKR